MSTVKSLSILSFAGDLTRIRGSYMSVNALLNLLNELV